MAPFWQGQGGYFQDEPAPPAGFPTGHALPLADAFQAAQISHSNITLAHSFVEDGQNIEHTAATTGQAFWHPGPDPVHQPGPSPDPTAAAAAAAFACPYEGCPKSYPRQCDLEYVLSIGSVSPPSSPPPQTSTDPEAKADLIKRTTASTSTTTPSGAGASSAGREGPRPRTSTATCGHTTRTRPGCCSCPRRRTAARAVGTPGARTTSSATRTKRGTGEWVKTWWFCMCSTFNTVRAWSDVLHGLMAFVVLVVLITPRLRGSFSQR